MKPIPHHRRALFGGFGRGLQILLGFAVLLAVTTLCLYFLVVRAPTDSAARGYELSKRIASDLAATFQLQPKIVERNTILLESRDEIAQLATTEVQYLVKHQMEHSWAGSTKRLEIIATARALGGFDLTQPIRVIFDETTQKALVVHPAPGLLAVEVRDTEFTRDESGWINRMSTEDRNNALRELETLAREEIDLQDLAARAESGFQNQVRRAFAALGIEEVEFQVESEPIEQIRPLPPPY